MHVELIVPGLLAVARQRLAALELLASRGRATREPPLPLERWLGEAFEVAAQPLPAGALTRLACDDAARDGYWLRADPLHVEVGSQGATLTPGAALGITREEAEALVTALNAHFGSELLWQAPRGDAWCVKARTELPCAEDLPAEAEASEPRLAPQGAAARRAHALVTEVQMLLHAHPLNAAREGRGTPTINSVWLWGAGRLPDSARGSWQSVTTDHPVATGLAVLARIEHHALPAGGASRWLEQMPRGGRHLCILPPTSSAEALEAAWFAPLLAALRGERIGMFTLCVPDAGRRWETMRADLRRFWRRARPLHGGAA